MCNYMCIKLQKFSFLVPTFHGAGISYTSSSHDTKIPHGVIYCLIATGLARHTLSSANVGDLGVLATGDPRWYIEAYTEPSISRIAFHGRLLLLTIISS